MWAVQRYMEQDHERLDALLKESVSSEFAPVIYNEFRKGLLRHIAIEEKLLFPLIRSEADAVSDAVIRQLRAHHGALAALLVPKGSTPLIAALETILALHNRLEEGPTGVYAALMSSSADATALLAQIASYAEVPLSGAIDKLEDLGPVRRAMERAGFDSTNYF